MINFIKNIAEFYPLNYFNEDFHKEVIAKSGYGNDDIKSFNKKVNGLKEKYYAFKKEMIESNLPIKDRVTRAHNFHKKLLNTLGYEGNKTEYSDFVYLSEKEAIPVRNKLYRGDNKPHLFIMEMQPMISYQGEALDGLFTQQWDTEEEASPAQKYHRSQWSNVFTVPEGVSISPMIINKAVGEIFLLDEARRPKYILLLAGNVVFLLEQKKWFKGQYLMFDLEKLFNDSVVEKNYLSLFYLMIGKEKLSPLADIVLMDQLEEESHKKAYEVTKDLKGAVVHAVESIANEAVFYMGDETMGLDADQLKNECLTYVYRLLFVFYAESREDLDILPSNDSVYQHGYSMEMLRDLEQVPLHTESSRDGYFFHESINGLFKLLHEGYRVKDKDNKSFSIRRIDSPMFDNDKMPYLSKIKIRNHIWQDIICQLSLSKQQKKKKRGRISYANLGINQLGSVYESLLAYRGVFAEEDQIVVHRKRKAKETSTKAASDGSYLVARSRYDEFEGGEIYYESAENGEDKLRVIPKGTFTYRLSGRDRQKSASYYTPEVLTKCTVKYTLKPILARLDHGKMKALDLLDLKILEPAMGAAAFHNEVINQLAEAYLSYRQEEERKENRVSPDKYQEELQKVKAYIALNNVYGVDLNPTAVELGKLSLWLNVIHKDMETPFFGYRLGVGNAVVGCWLKGYKVKDVTIGSKGKSKVKSNKKEWWTLAPDMLAFDGKKIKRPGTGGNELIYHFLLPDKGMVPSASIKLLKAAYPEHAKAVSEWRKQICQPLDSEEVSILRGLCKVIDELIEEHYLFQKKVDLETMIPVEIYGMDGKQFKLDYLSYDEKAKMAENRSHTESPFFKLKMVMDYWCSLWYWDVRNAEELPTRRDWYHDIANILQIDLNDIKKEKEVKSKPESIDKQLVKQANLTNKENQLTLDYRSDEDNTNAWADTIVAYGDKHSAALFTNNRLRLVKEMADRYKYFHYQLEFIEVFRERSGFDIAVGNPPWLKLQFEEKGLMSEVFPELQIRKVPAPQVRKLQKAFLSIEEQAASYFNEYVEIESAATFMNGFQNYPLLKGQQTNLYKCVLENGFKWVNKDGYLGLLHPEGIYDDPKGIPLREEVYQRLKYHFQFKNELILFAEVHHEVVYGANIYSGGKDIPKFFSINNLFHPSTIEGSFLHSGHGLAGGYKVRDEQTGKMAWNVEPHKSRIVEVTEKELKIIAQTFEGTDQWEGAKLVSIHAKEIIEVIAKIGQFQKSVNDYETKISEGWHETNDYSNGYIKRQTQFPKINQLEMIYSGPHFFGSNPMYKTPRESCTLNSHYDIIDHTQIAEDYVARTNYVPAADLDNYKRQLGKFEDNSWLKYYKIGFRKMLSQAGERTLTGAILPPNTAHVNGVISVLFKENSILSEFIGLTSSVVFDFFIKTIGKSNLYEETIKGFPLGIASNFKEKLIARSFQLNCLNKYYADLWQDQFEDVFKKDQWSKLDPRLKSFSTLKREWTWDIPLRNFYERRWALVEIDVITAMALSLTLDELTLIYNVQFPVLQQNENDTWYDTKGKIVFTCSKGLTGVGMDRIEWDHIRELETDHTIDCSRYENMRCDTPGEITYTITKSELYYGEERTYYAPFDKCDRVKDYRVAWAFFSKMFAEGDKSGLV